ncbi:FAD-dependent oxidoreductase [Acinetobacter sp. S40]|uniref:FAD-dependent oxidoreductase n=1 Tax=unclassified Acinetobacter TaxID=196816 RepID=UPI00190DFD40|nr:MULTISPECIES: FAD-dependent oxidoreductase [unclassified Acinetobacter]MBJ9984922.1 FAD-dependent oxidoreductase [Acinetobacter sp. S40]MBK0063087.1 FAD-dependent oxidoreductase [Acinetobacter sp. S55]MBK0066495.1 FAD-dependent oxidoreductase [Acinetobacter sp. S54]
MDQQVDLLVIGAGAAGMSAALFAKLNGLDVLLCEKAAHVGGTSATSGGTIWAPGSHLSFKAGVPDDIEQARIFLKSVVGERGGEELREAFLASSADMIRELDEKTTVKLNVCLAHPDYIKNQPGEAFGGRALAPAEFDGSVLGADFKYVRPPRPEFMGLGGMMVNRNELNALLNPVQSFQNFMTTLKVVLPYLFSRLRFNRGTRLVMGNALVGSLFHNLRQQHVPVWLNSPLQELLIENGKVIGAKIQTETGTQVIYARKGVVLATGGVGWNEPLRQQLFPKGLIADSLSPLSNTGDGLIQAIQKGAKLDPSVDSSVLYFPCSIHTHANGYKAIWPHIILDRSKPGVIAVNDNGKRFVNESDSYHDFCMAQIKSNAGKAKIQSYLICDHTAIEKYGLGFVLPGAKKLDYYLKANYLFAANTLEQLAQKTGIDAQSLVNTVQHFNQMVEQGVDTDFGKGTGAMNRFNGDPEVKPNPCLGKIETGPYYALPVIPMDCASSGGLAGDIYGRVLDQNNQVISGLFACGNDLASIFKGTYPGPGTTLGPGMVFAWRIAQFAAGKLTEQFNQQTIQATQQRRSA